MTIILYFFAQRKGKRIIFAKSKTQIASVPPTQSKTIISKLYPKKQMKIYGLSLTAVLLLTGTTHAFAQKASSDNKPMVELTANVKTYYLDRMGYAPNATLADVIGSPSQNLLVNGEECNDNIFLSLTHVSQVERIEYITNNQSGAFVNKSGSINVVLKEKEGGIHGHANFDIDTHANYAPWLNLTNKKGNWTIWANARGGISEVKTETYESGHYNKKDNLYYGSYFNSLTGDYDVTDYYNQSEHYAQREHELQLKSDDFIIDFGTQYKNEKNTLTIHIFDSFHHYNSTSQEEKSSHTNSYYNINVNKSETDSYKHYSYSAYNEKENNKYNTLFSELNFKHIVNNKTTLHAVLSGEYMKSTFDGNIERGYLTCDNEDTYNKYNTLNRIKSIGMTQISGINQMSYNNHPISSNQDNYTAKLNAYANIKPTNDITLKTGLYLEWHNEDYANNTNYINDDNPYAVYSTVNDKELNKYSVMPYALASYRHSCWSLNVGERLIYRDDKYSGIRRNKTEEMGVTYYGFGNPKDYDADKLLTATNASFVITPCDNHHFMLSYLRYTDYRTNLQYGNNFESTQMNTLLESTITNNKIDFDYTFSGTNISTSFNATYRKENTVRIATKEDVNGTLGTISSPNVKDEDNSIRYYNLGATTYGTFGIFSLRTRIEYSSVKESRVDWHRKTWHININPILNLPFNIKASANANYIHTINPKDNTSLSEIQIDILDISSITKKEDWTCTFLLSKQWKSLELFAKWENALHKKQDDTYSSFLVLQKASGVQVSQIINAHRIHDDHNNQVVFGLSYRF